MEKEINDTKDIKETKNNETLKKLKKAGAIFLAGTCLVATASAAVIGYNVENAKSALNIQNIQASNSSIMEIEKKFGKTISGRYLDLLITFSNDYKGDVVKIGDTYISESGKPFNNSLSGCDTMITLADGTSICIDNYEGNGKIYQDAGDVIDPISRDELREDYELSLIKDDKGYSYKLTQKK